MTLARNSVSLLIQKIIML